MQVAYIKSLEIGSKSSRRTDILHNGIGDLVQTIRPDFRYKIEEKLKTDIGTFKIDVMVHKEGIPLAYINVKAPMCSIKKNITNTENACFGEVIKLYNSYPNIPIVRFDFHPISCPTYGALDKITAIETFDIQKIREKSREFIRLTDPYKLGKPMLQDHFIVFTDIDQKSKKDITFKSFVDDTDIQRFTEFIRSL